MRCVRLWLLSTGIAGLVSAQNQPFRISLSVSPFTELLFRGGARFTDGKGVASNVEELERLFMRYSANELYARIATTREHKTGFGDHSLNKGLDRARLAKSLGLAFNPEIGLFDIYGDVRCQPPPDFRDYPEIKAPGPWVSLTLDQMLPVLKAYGAIAAREILKTGVKVRIWDLGNEVEFGMAGVAVHPMPGGCDDTEGGSGWYKPPDKVDPAIGKTSVIELLRMPEPERITWLETHLWPRLAGMFAATAAGIRSVDPAARFSTHVSGVTAVLPAQAVAFYQAMRKGGFSPDELGFSFYPSSSDRPPHRLEAFQQTVTVVHRALDRPVFIAEFGYPAEPVREGAFAGWNHPLDKYPLTPEGQASLLHDLVAWGAESGVSGIRPWAPELVVPGWAPFALFRKTDKGIASGPGLAAISEGLASIKK